MLPFGNVAALSQPTPVSTHHASRNPQQTHTHTNDSMGKMRLLPPCLWLLHALVSPQAHALQTTRCDTTEAERARVMRKALKQLADKDYEILPGMLSFPDFAQPAGRYGLGT